MVGGCGCVVDVCVCVCVCVYVCVCVCGALTLCLWVWAVASTGHTCRGFEKVVGAVCVVCCGFFFFFACNRSRTSVDEPKKAPLPLLCIPVQPCPLTRFAIVTPEPNLERRKP